MRRAGLKEKIYEQYQLLKKGVIVVTETEVKNDSAKEKRISITSPLIVERSKVIKWRSKGY